MLENLGELSQFFDVDKGEDLFKHCINLVNSKQPRVYIKALKALISISVRMGQSKVEEKILPIVEEVMKQFDDDILVLEGLKGYNLLATLRLLNQSQCEKILNYILPFLLHPNRQIRDCATRYIYILATLGHNEQAVDAEHLGNLDSHEAKLVTKINYKKGPLYSQV